jgi:predicted DNA-binding protein (MmcQ/YjbR family)
MTVDALREYCLAKGKDVTEGFPFGEEYLVFKVRQKMFLLLSIDDHPQSMNVKCDPERAVEMRERYAAVRPGYHMNKKHWNTVVFDGSIPPKELREMIDQSYDLVCGGVKDKPLVKTKNKNAARKKS